MDCTEVGEKEWDIGVIEKKGIELVLGRRNWESIDE
jgi:hypothetical protein